MIRKLHPLRFGIRGKVAILVVIAAGVSAYLVARLLSRSAVELLRQHELVDLGDEARLRGWEIADGVGGVREDTVAILLNEPFQARLMAGASPEELSPLVEELCRRYWRRYLRVDVVPLGAGSPGNPSMVLKKEAEIDPADLWLPPVEESKNGRRGSRLFVSEIQRVRVTYPPAGEGAVSRTVWTPVIWTAALIEGPEDTEKPPRLVRIAMSLEEVQSPRHLFALLSEENRFLVRPDEYDESEENNDEIFFAIATNPVVVDRLRHQIEDSYAETGEQPQVQSLELFEYQPLKSTFYFQEGLPRDQLGAAINADDREKLDLFMENLRNQTNSFGRLGGLSSGVAEVRILAPEKGELQSLRDRFVEALKDRYGNSFDGITWRKPVVCDEVHAWTIRLGVGSVEHKSNYMLIYAVMDDELASSIRQEMEALRKLALLVALFAGGIAFVISMFFIRPLQRMTQTAQRVSEAEPERFVAHLRRLVDHLPVERKDEVGDIARASERLFEEILNSHAELENRVRERTASLARTNIELEEANEQLKSLSREKDTFVAKVSHDLRQPLNAIFLQVEALKLSELDDLQTRDVQKIHDHALRELNLVNDILEYQKIIMGAEELKPETIEVAALMDQLADSHDKVATGKGIEFHKVCGENTGTLEADPKRLRQILDNLIGNAVKFTVKGGVTIEAHRRTVSGADWIEFNIADTGRGMSEEEQQKAFVPFVSNKKGNEGGTGLGLSISQELCHQMGGKIGFVSELGKGTRFTVLLPCRTAAKPEAPAAGLEPQPPEPGRISEPAASVPDAGRSSENRSPVPIGGKILVVDDDPSVREVVKRLLEREGCTVATAESGEEGLRLAREFEPDAITLDVVMPEKDGWKVLSELKSDPRTEAIPVIMVSIMADESRGLAMGVADCLEKPVDVGRFTRAIRRAVGHSEQRSILVVDDEVDSRQALCRLLASEGWRPVEAGDGREAIAFLARRRPAAILLDLLMPGMDGFEFIEELVKRAEFDSIPILVVTGKRPSGEEAAFLERRVDEIIEKGEKTGEQILSRVRELIKTRVAGRGEDG